MKLEQLIKKLGLPANPRKSKGDYYGISHYWKFNDDSLVMEKEQFEMYMCQQEQEWFWEEANDRVPKDFEHPPRYISEILNNNTKFLDEDGWLEDVLEGAYFSNVEEHVGQFQSLADALEGGIYYHTKISLTSRFSYPFKNIIVDVTPYFEEYFSKSTGFFCWGASSEGEILNWLTESIDSDEYQYELWFDLKTELQKHFPQHASKLITLIQGGEASAIQAFDLINALDDAGNFDDWSEVFGDRDFAQNPFSAFEEIKVALTEIEPSPSDPFTDLFDWVLSEFSSQMDWGKPFSLYHAYTHKPSQYGERTLYIDENGVNYDICDRIKVDLNFFKDSSLIYDVGYKQIFQVGDWFIARP